MKQSRKKSNKIVIHGQNSYLTFASSGALESLYFQGGKLLKAARNLFTVHLLDFEGERHEAFSSEFLDRSFENYIWHFGRYSKFPGLKIKVAVRVKKDQYFFRPSVHNIPDGYFIERIDCPQLIVNARGNLFSPYSEGVLVHEPASRQFITRKFRDIYSNNYPGVCQMQYFAYYDSKERGIYFAAHDFKHGPKNIDFGGDGKDRVRLRIDTFCGGNKNGREYQSDFEYVITAFQGNWMDAAEIYRDWIKDDPVLQTRPELPEWINDSPIIITYPVRGKGSISSEPNEFFPYENAMPYILKLAEELESRIMVILMRWDGHAPWAPPEIWPPLGGVVALDKFRQLLHNSDHLLGLYGSGTSWTLKTKNDDYSTEKKFKTERLERFMAVDEKGEIYSGFCPEIRAGYLLCMCEEFGQKTIEGQIMAIANAGVDFLQFFDQNLGGTAPICYSKHHHHHPIPGVHQISVMQDFLKEVNKKIRTSGSKMILGTECAAAGPYVKELPFNDLRSTSASTMGMAVPAYSFVYHEYFNNFMGNQVMASNIFNNKKSPENLLYRIAYHFSAGTLLTINLRSGGQLDWGAAADWDSPVPDQQTTLILLRNLNAVRKKYPEFLQYGRMIKPKWEFEGEEYCLSRMGRDERIPAFTVSSWLSPKGDSATIIVNFLAHEQIIKYKLPSAKETLAQMEIAPLSAKIIRNEQ